MPSSGSLLGYRFMEEEGVSFNNMEILAKWSGDSNATWEDYEAPLEAVGNGIASVGVNLEQPNVLDAAQPGR